MYNGIMIRNVVELDWRYIFDEAYTSLGCILFLYSARCCKVKTWY